MRRIALVVMLACTPPTFAAFDCTIDGGFPSVVALYVQNDQLRALISPYHSDSEPGLFMGKQLALGADGTWTMLEDSEIPRSEYAIYADQCVEAAIDEDWIKDYKHIPELDGSFQQSIGACAVDGDELWGGISFYAGEGSWGVGGLVRKNIASGEIKYFRPSQLSDVSVSHIANYAGDIWVGTAHYGECGIQEVAYGVRRFSPNSRFTGAFPVPEICGFAVNDIVTYKNQLWTATELGLTKLENIDGQLVWQHYVPDISKPELMRPISCDDLYKEILMSDRLAAGNVTDNGQAFEEFWLRLNNLRPDFTSKHLRELHGHSPRE